jgi:hypothetical protein
VALYPIEGGFEIELVGEIANMVAVASDDPQRKAQTAQVGAAGDDLFRSSVKVVAGACNRRDRNIVRVDI